MTAATTAYDGSGRLQSVTNIDGTTSYAYNVAARTTTITYPDTGVEVIETDAQGNVVRRVDGLNRTTTYTFDANNNLLTETNPLSKTWTYTYDANGFRTSVKNPLNQIDSVTYNAYGGPTAVTNALSQTQTVTYDASFRVKTITDSLGQIADFSYNPQGLPLTMKDARANTSSYGYDAYGNRTSYADPEGRTTNATFNAFGQKLTETDARGNKTTSTYDDLPFSGHPFRGQRPRFQFLGRYATRGQRPWFLHGSSTRGQRPWFRFPAAPPDFPVSRAVYAKAARRSSPFRQSSMADPVADYITVPQSGCPPGESFVQSRRPPFLLILPRDPLRHLDQRLLRPGEPP
ncbi:MAG: hypothetical protein ACKV22_00545 [Bryobacteraceae bacterium]